ncbi:VWA domain-containing protein [Amycolatopsis sp., V23-08]|uniref:VWA domain-containing protein n=1 Tax=Amycolatopsis heterodermiae TaxID=3110235 RepID=A0ABU5R9J5_9PSEU|nr:VWA domain-containing protein [Amycolatopsis sp., V23-08]MEA5362911.1 VWA domain-containing protein [Amycolatopsis sp., V23-08]
MARTTWWRVGLVVLLTAALVSWVAGSGWLDWMLADHHPARNVLEALSWPAGVLAFLWLAVPSLLKWARPADSTADTPPRATTMTAHRGTGVTIQAGRDIRGKTVLKTVRSPGDHPDEPASPAADEPDEPDAPASADASTMRSHTGSGTTIQAVRDIRGGIRMGTFLSVPMPRAVRTLIIVVLVVALAGGAVAAVVTWVLPEFAPTYKTEFLVDLSATGADQSAVAESSESLRKAIGNTGDDDAVALRTFGGQCGTDGNTSQVVTFGTGNRDDIGSAMSGASVSGAATLVRGLIGAAEDFSAPFSQNAKQVNRIVVVTRNGVDACDDDTGFVQREIRDRLAASGLAVEFRFVGYRLADKDKPVLDKLASSASAPPPVLAQDPAELQAALDWIANVEPVLRSAHDVVGALNPVAKQLNDAAQAVVDGRMDVADRTLAAIKPASADVEFSNLESRAKTPDAIEVYRRATSLRDRQKNAVPAVTGLLDLARAGKPFAAELTAFRHEADLYNSEVDVLNTLLARMRAAGPGGH